MEEATILVTCARGAIEPLEMLSREYDAEFQSSDRRNLDGEILTWSLVIISVSIKTAPAFLRSLAQFLQRNQVERIEIDGIVIEKPRPEDVNELKAHLLHAQEGDARREP
jgi:hypothetical protein